MHGDRSAADRAGPDLTRHDYWSGTIKMSLSRFFILRVLDQRPMHGYEIARTVESVTRGCCSPSEGAIYPTLREFEAGGYVTARREVVGGRERRVYSLTARGREAFRVGVAAWMEATRCLLETAPVVSDCPEASRSRCGPAEVRA